jgi:hypothetical protein
MKTLKYKILTLAALMLATMAANAGMIEKKRMVRKSFAVNKNTSVELNSKYGTINVSNWDKDSVAFRIEIIGKSNSEGFSQEMIEDTEVRFSANDAFIVMNTEFKDEGAQLVTTLNKVTKSLGGGSKSEVLVNINVMIPEWCSIDVEHKFGDVIMSSRSSKVIVNTSYCDVKMGELTGYTDLNVKFGDLNIQTVKRLNLDCEYADVVIFKAENADIDSKGSKLNIHEIGKLRARTKRDDFTIYKAGSVNADGSYSDVVITDLSGSINFNGKFGDITVHNVEATFTQITMNCERSNANLSFDSSCNFSLDLNLEMGDLTYPMGMIKVTEKSEEDGDRTKYYGYVGSNSKPTSKMEIFGKETDVNITLK